MRNNVFENSSKIKNSETMNEIINSAGMPQIKNVKNMVESKNFKQTQEIKNPFLTRQITVKGRSTEELFQILQEAINRKPIQLIATPRIDAVGNAYYWIGIRVDRAEIDFKLLVNEQIMDYIFAYIKGDETLPTVTDFTPYVPGVELSKWLRENELKHCTPSVKFKEELQVNEDKNYLVKKLIYRNGKFIYSSVEITDVLSLIMID